MFVNASGNPVATAPVTCQLELPSEPATSASVGAINIVAVVLAIGSLVTAVSSGNPAAIIAAIQALINAITGK